MIKLSITEIMELIPHRYPFLLLDEVIECIKNDSIVGIKNISFNEPQFLGHFPNNPIMPGVLIIESLAQVSAVLVSISISSIEDKDVYFMAIEEAKFRKIVTPGDKLYLFSKIEQCRGHVWKFNSCAKVNGDVVAESKFTAMIKNKKDKNI